MSEPLVYAPRFSRIDYQSAQTFQDELLAAVGGGDRHIIVDMGAVEYISSIGLRAFVVASKQITGERGRLAVAALAPLVREVFAISRFDRLLDVYDTVSAAREAAT